MAFLAKALAVADDDLQCIGVQQELCRMNCGRLKFD